LDYVVEVFRSYNKEKNPNSKYKTPKELIEEIIFFFKEVSSASLQQKELDFKEYFKQFTNKKRKKS